MRRILAIGGVFALAAPLLVLVPSTLEPAHAFGEPGIGWKYHEGTHSYYQDPPSAAEAGPAERPTRYVDWGKGDMDSYACPTEPIDGSQFECAGENNPTGDFCNSLPGENGRPVAPRVVFERVFNNPQQNGNPPWRPLPPADWDAEHYVQSCHELPEEYVVTQEEVQEVNYELFQGLDGLDPQLDPSDRTLVNLRTIAYTEYPENVEGDLIEQVDVFEPDLWRPHIKIRDEVPGKVAPFEFTIDAYADIHWTFEGANPSTAQGRGNPYDGSTLPEDAGPEKYVTVQFTTDGPHEISVGATWTGMVTVNSPGGQGPEPMDPVVIDPVPETVQVSEAESVIVD
jgi:hypothetical protein